MIGNIITRTHEEFALCCAIRRRVFVDEVGLPDSRDSDEFDYYARHYLFTTTDGQPVGTARSRIEGIASKIERFAILPEYRGKGLAAEAFTFIMNDCLSRFPGCPLTLQTPVELEEFFVSLGFVAEEKAFLDAGIRVRRMACQGKETHPAMSAVKNRSKTKDYNNIDI